MRSTSTAALAGLVASAAAQYKTLVSPEALVKDVKLEDLLADSQKLQDFADAAGGNRAFGGAGHNATVDWLFETLSESGYYDVYKDEFVDLFSSAVVAASAAGESFTAAYMTYSPSGNVTADLIAVNDIGCTAADYPAEVSGNIALISRGTCPFGEKASLAKAAGAAGAVIYNNVDGDLAGTLGGTGDYAPTVGVTNEVGQSLLDQITAGGVEVHLDVDATEENRTTWNVIAETKGGDHDNVLVLGGHTDSVFAGPGINDDGSGTVGVIGVAKALTKYTVKNAVRFGFWSAEEFGLLGSNHYLKTINGSISGSPEEVGKIRAYLNFDMIASPNYVFGIYDGDGSGFNFSGPPGSDTIEKDFEAFYDSKKLNHTPSIFSGRSDYAAFLENGIPSGGLFTGAEEIKTEAEAALFGGEAGVALDANYHKAGDNVDNLNHEAFLVNSQAIANSVAKYALAFDGIPQGNGTLRRRSADLHRYAERFVKAHTHAHGAPCGNEVKSEL